MFPYNNDMRCGNYMSQSDYNNYPIRNEYGPNQGGFDNDGNRFFLAPFLVGGLAGTALGYGIANNNQLNNQGGYYYGPAFYPFPYSYPTSYPTYIYPSQNTYYF